MALPVIAAIGRVAKAGYDAYKMSKKVRKVKKLMKKGDASAYSAANRDARHKLLSKKKYQNKATRNEGKRLGLNSAGKKKYQKKAAPKKDLGVKKNTLSKNEARKRLDLDKEGRKGNEMWIRHMQKQESKSGDKDGGKVIKASNNEPTKADLKFKKQMKDFKEWSKTAITKAKKEKK